MLSNSTLRYHYHPEKGWLNDPNGLCFFKGKYHIFYQHNTDTEYPVADRMVWGHAVTTDFLHFEELPVAVSTGESYDCNGVWSGTAAEKDGRLYCYYAGISETHKQTVNLAFSDDGLHFEKYAGNPVIPDFPADGSNDFRDPAVLTDGDNVYLAVASADKKKKTGNVLLYKSRNMTDFSYVGVLTEYEDCVYCECPSFVRDGDRYILSVSVCPNGKPHYFEVLRGDFDGKTFLPETVSHFQKGPDEYAGQIFHAPDGRNILISWVSGWDYRTEEKCIGALSIPLEIKAKDGKITAYPVREVAHLVDGDCITDDYITEKYINGGEEVHITIDKARL